MPLQKRLLDSSARVGPPPGALGRRTRQRARWRSPGTKSSNSLKTMSGWETGGSDASANPFALRDRRRAGGRNPGGIGAIADQLSLVRQKKGRRGIILLLRQLSAVHDDTFRHWRALFPKPVLPPGSDAAAPPRAYQIALKRARSYLRRPACRDLSAVHHRPARARRIAGLSGFLTLSQSRDGADRQGAISRFDTLPLQPEL
jgi:hypothetical protein